MTTFIQLPLTGASAYWANAVSNVAGLPTGTVNGEVAITVDTRVFYSWDGAAWTAVPVNLSVAAITGVLPIANGGTNSSTALNSGRAVITTAGKIVEATTTSTEIGYVSGVTSAIQTQFAGKQATGNYITALTSDVTAAGPGSVAATVASVGGSTAANVHAAELLANAATNLNTASAIVKRDASGNFVAGTVDMTLARVGTTTTRGVLTVESNSATKPGLYIETDQVYDVMQIYTTGLGQLMHINSAGSGFFGKLQTTGGGDATGPDYSTSSDASSGMFSPGGFPLAWSVHGVEYMRLGASGGLRVGSAGNPTAGAALDVNSTTLAFMPPRVTTTQMNAMTVSNGALVYNSTADLFYGYVAGAWTPLHGWGY